MQSFTGVPAEAWWWWSEAWESHSCIGGLQGFPDGQVARVKWEGASRFSISGEPPP